MTPLLNFSVQDGITLLMAAWITGLMLGMVFRLVR